MHTSINICICKESYPGIETLSCRSCRYYGNSPLLKEAYNASVAYGRFVQSVPLATIEAGLGDWMALEDK